MAGDATPFAGPASQARMKSMLSKVTLNNTDLVVSKLCYGTNMLGTAIDQAHADRLLDRFVQLAETSSTRRAPMATGFQMRPLAPASGPSAPGSRVVIARAS